MGAHSAETGLAAEAPDSARLRLLTFNQEHAPARSAGLITAETSEAFPPAGGQALEVDPVEVASMVAAVDAIGDRIYWHAQLVKFQNGEEHHAAKGFDFYST
jgi:hypothetical protein